MKFTKIKIVVLMLVFLCLGIVGCNQSKSLSLQKQPNIVFIMTDDHSIQTMSTYDKRFIETPNLDRIADDGVVFRNSFVSNSICGPSRAVLLTGKHSHKNGQINNTVSFDGNQQTFPKILQKKGYQTSIIGKWHLKSEPTGFDHFEVLVGQGDYYNSPFIANGDTIKSHGYVTNVITNKSIDWLNNRDRNKPFCLMVHHKATHRIWQPDIELFDEFKNTEFEVPENFFDDYKGRTAAKEQVMSLRKDMDLVYDLKLMDKEGEIQTKYRELYEEFYNKMTPAQQKAWDKEYTPIIEDFKNRKFTEKELDLYKYKRYMQDYLRCVRSVDNNVGKLLDYLDAQGLSENTLVVYTSDQGFYMGEHGWFDKRFMYEQSLRTPLVMRYPKKIKPKTEITEMVQNIDYAPTFLELAGIEVPKDMQGTSVWPLFEKEQPTWRDAIYYHYYEFPNEHMVKKHYGIRTKRYKLIHFYDDIDVWELFDLVNDPSEMNNIYNNTENKTLIKSLKKRLLELQVTYDDTNITAS